MGYRPKRKTYRLRFADPEMKGLVVEASSVPVGTFKDIIKLLGTIETTEDDAEAVARLFEMFADALVTWNLEDDSGEPVPTTVEGIDSQDFDFMLAVIMSWVSSVGDVPAPLEQTSNGGGPSLVASLPMEPLSASQAS